MPSLADISIGVVPIPARSQLITPGPHRPMTETDGAESQVFWVN
jgi:hypothetical protein